MDSVYLADWNNSILADDELQPTIARHPDLVHRCLSPELIELIVNICDELSLSSEVEFTCLDNFDVYCRRRYAQILEQVARPGSVTAAATAGGPVGVVGAAPPATDDSGTCSGPNGGGPTAARASLTTPDRTMNEMWQSEMERFSHDAPVRLVAVLMLSGKMIGNGGPVKPMRLRAIVSLMRAVRPSLTELDMKVAEYEVHASRHGDEVRTAKLCYVCFICRCSLRCSSTSSRR